MSTGAIDTTAKIARRPVMVGLPSVLMGKTDITAYLAKGPASVYMEEADTHAKIVVGALFVSTDAINISAVSDMM